MSRGLSTCTECGLDQVKIWRRYKGEKFCSTCYCRLFKHGICTKCKKKARLPIFANNPICINCERDVPCIRCGKEKYKTGAITKYGPVCNSCSVHYRAKKKCELCGNVTKGVSKYHNLDHHLRVCPKCYSDALCETCPNCHRYRVLQQNLNGEMVCKLCATIGKIKCKQCGEMKPAGYGKKCEDCYWKELLEKRVKNNLKSFETNVMTNHFESFSKWFEKRKGSGFAAMKINKFLDFFLKIETKWGDIPEYPKLLKYFTANKLRLVRLPMFWFQEDLGMVVDHVLKEDVTEDSRSKKLRDTFLDNTVNSKIITDYYYVLMKKLKSKKTTIRSIRLALRPAVELLKLVDKLSSAPPTQKHVDKFLIQTPGQKAGITGFLNFINKNTGSSLKPKVNNKKAAEYRRNLLEKEMIGLMLNYDDSEKYKKRWIITGLQFFHKLPERKASEVYKGKHIEDNKGLYFDFENNIYFIPISSSKH